MDSKLSIKVLDIDTITQVKEKILNALYRHTPASERPLADQIELGKWKIISS